MADSAAQGQPGHITSLYDDVKAAIRRLNAEMMERMPAFSKPVRAWMETGGNDQIDFGVYGNATAYETGSVVPTDTFTEYTTDFANRPWGGSWT